MGEIQQTDRKSAGTDAKTEPGQAAQPLKTGDFAEIEYTGFTKDDEIDL